MWTHHARENPDHSWFMTGRIRMNRTLARCQVVLFGSWSYRSVFPSVPVTQYKSPSPSNRTGKRIDDVYLEGEASRSRWLRALDLNQRATAATGISRGRPVDHCPKGQKTNQDALGECLMTTEVGLG